MSFTAHHRNANATDSGVGRLLQREGDRTNGSRDHRLRRRSGIINGRWKFCLRRPQKQIRIEQEDSASRKTCEDSSSSEHDAETAMGHLK